METLMATTMLVSVLSADTGNETRRRKGRMPEKLFLL
jgi:hypothetical protein